MYETRQSVPPAPSPRLQDLFGQKERLLQQKDNLLKRLKSVKRWIAITKIGLFVGMLPAALIAALGSWVIIILGNMQESTQLMQTMIGGVIFFLALSPLIVTLTLLNKKKAGIRTELSALKSEYERMGLEYKETYRAHTAKNFGTSTDGYVNAGEPTRRWNDPDADDSDTPHSGWDDSDDGWGDSDGGWGDSDGGDWGDSDGGSDWGGSDSDDGGDD